MESDNTKELPPGAKPEDVADDIPAKLSEGEFVIPAHIVRFIGVEKLEDMVSKASEKLATIHGEDGEEVPAEDDVELPFSPEELVGYAEGGLVKEPTNNLLKEEGFFGIRQYQDPTGEVRYIPFINGKPSLEIPDTYKLFEPEQKGVSQVVKENPVTTQNNTPATSNEPPKKSGLINRKI